MNKNITNEKQEAFFCMVLFALGLSLGFVLTSPQGLAEEKNKEHRCRCEH